MYKTIELDIHDSIATISLNRPGFGNSFDKTMFEETIQTFHNLADDERVKIIILRANGKIFSGGGDINKFNKLLETREPFDLNHTLNPGRLVMAIRNNPKPVIAVVQGSAAGAGFGLAMACDYRIIGKKTKLVPAFNGIGLPGDNGLFYLLGKQIGPSKLFQYFTTNQIIRAEEAIDLGIITKSVDDEHLDKEALDFANFLLNTPLKVLSIQKDWLNRFFYPDLEAALELEAMQTHLSSKEQALFEAVGAFLRKEKPDFTRVN